MTSKDDDTFTLTMLDEMVEKAKSLSPLFPIRMIDGKEYYMRFVSPRLIQEQMGWTDEELEEYMESLEKSHYDDDE